MNSSHDISVRDGQARLRFSIIGALLAAPPAQGELLGVLRALAAKHWRDPATRIQQRFTRRRLYQIRMADLDGPQGEN